VRPTYLLHPRSRTHPHRRLLAPARTPTHPDPDPDPEGELSTAQQHASMICRAIDIDISEGPRCGGALRVLAVIAETCATAVILEHIATRAAPTPPIASL